jgi:class 3 adenylate cyclase
MDVPDPVESARYLADRISGARTLELTREHRVPGRAALDRGLDETKVVPVHRVGRWGVGGAGADRVSATVLFTDIVGSSDRAAQIGARAWRELLERHHELVRRQLVRFRGKEVDIAGDGFLTSFDGPARAIRCAEAVVEGVHAARPRGASGPAYRRVRAARGQGGGIAVHMGARVASEAAACEVLVSSTVKDLVAGSGLAFEDRGMHEIKGVPGEWRLYVVEA